jgi:hypothetical protein
MIRSPRLNQSVPLPSDRRAENLPARDLGRSSRHALFAAWRRWLLRRSSREDPPRLGHGLPHPLPGRRQLTQPRERPLGGGPSLSVCRTSFPRRSNRGNSSGYPPLPRSSVPKKRRSCTTRPRDDRRGAPRPGQYFAAPEPPVIVALVAGRGVAGDVDPLDRSGDGGPSSTSAIRVRIPIANRPIGEAELVVTVPKGSRRTASSRVFPC